MRKSWFSPFLVLTMLLLQLGCSKENSDGVTPAEPAGATATDARSGRKVSPGGPTVTASFNFSCGSYMDGNYGGSGYYTYSDRIISVTSIAQGNVSISVSALDVPNRFTVYDANGNFVTSSPWLGYSSTPGPWGSSLNGPSSQVLTFTKVTSSYRLRVETVTSGVTDYWSARVSCTATCTSQCPGTPITGGSCGANFSGNYGGSGYYTYSDRTVDLSAVPNGKTVSISVNSLDVPNRFTVYDANGNFVTSSPWLGYSSTPGPWGSSLNGPSSQTLSFTKSTATYRLRVETVTSGVTDYWDASVRCGTY